MNKYIHTCILKYIHTYSFLPNFRVEGWGGGMGGGGGGGGQIANLGKKPTPAHLVIIRE